MLSRMPDLPFYPRSTSDLPQSAAVAVQLSCRTRIHCTISRHMPDSSWMVAQDVGSTGLCVAAGFMVGAVTGLRTLDTSRLLYALVKCCGSTQSRSNSKAGIFFPAAVNFPSAPSVGRSSGYASNITYVWTGYSWAIKAASGGSVSIRRIFHLLRLIAMLVGPEITGILWIYYSQATRHAVDCKP